MAVSKFALSLGLKNSKFSCLAGVAPQAGAVMRLEAGAAEILLNFQPSHHFVIALGSQTHHEG